MKKLLFFFFFAFTFALNVFAQSEIIHYKKDGSRTFFRVISDGKDTYYMTFNSKDGKINPDFRRSNLYFKSAYDKSKVNEQILNYESDDINEKYRDVAKDLSNTYISDEASIRLHDSKDISAKVKKDIMSSSKLVVGSRYKLLEITRAEDESLIGCDVICQVMERRKSNISGSEGRLVLRPVSIEKRDGSQVRLLPTDIYRRGKNVTNIKTWLTPLLIIPAFIPGSGAKIKQDERFRLRIE